jgi:hypothetical protein
MRVLAVGAAFAWIVTVVAACSSDGSGTSGGDAGPNDGGNPPGCPASRPMAGAPCAPDGLSCSYGCNTQAACSAGTWAVAQSEIACQLPDGGPADGSRRLPDGAIICNGDADCRASGQGGFLSCSPGGRITGCGICMRPENPCNVDSDCALINDAAPPKPMVCEPLTGGCVCPVGTTTGECIAACQADADCGPNFACASGHCVAKPCAGNADCSNTSTEDFACNAGKCGPKACKSDGDCGAHNCVNGICYPDPGICVPPAA